MDAATAPREFSGVSRNESRQLGDDLHSRMGFQMVSEVWAQGSTYEAYVGRWSRLIAREFIAWLSAAPGRRWLDIGCGTGALTDAILAAAQPEEVVGIDLSPAYVAHARERFDSSRVRFEIGDAQALPVSSGSFDLAVSGLALNFVPAPARAVGEMARAVPLGGVVAVYVWDYAGRMEMMRRFWDAAVALNPSAAQLDEGVRFPLSNPDSLASLWRDTRLEEVEVRAIDASTRFTDFDDFWSPFLGGQGPAPGYLMSLSEGDRARLRVRIKDALPIAVDGSISLLARAWAVRGVRGDLTD
jgi:SAM-dependent methyltransferase